MFLWVLNLGIYIQHQGPPIEAFKWGLYIMPWTSRNPATYFPQLDFAKYYWPRITHRFSDKKIHDIMRCVPSLLLVMDICFPLCPINLIRLVELYEMIWWLSNQRNLHTYRHKNSQVISLSYNDHQGSSCSRSLQLSLHPKVVKMFTSLPWKLEAS